MTRAQSFRIGVAVIQDGKKRFLISRRPKGKHLPGLWEFPGGKCELREPIRRCIIREVREEVGISVSVGHRLMKLIYHYPDRTVALHFHACRIVTGVPRPLERQQLKWVPLSRLHRYPHPEANLVLLKRLKVKGF